MAWQVRLGLILVSCSVLVYILKITLIDNLPGTIEYIFNSAGFLFINVLFVTLVINGLLARRAKNERLEKLNIVIGIFFTEVGNELLKRIVPADKNASNFGKSFILNGKEVPDGHSMIRAAESHHFELNSEVIDLKEMHDFLQENRNFLLRLMENPVMLEHQSFTSLLMAAFHLTAELGYRKNLSNLTVSDRAHLTGDINRVYQALTKEWISYMEYLSLHYPYLYSLAVRTNPYDMNAIVEVE
ncbi:hypothetical protein [Methanospirillum lacunae]|uniref:hypothetical protein n=1 Tax=Methanospirillum lacunae TaxID=668570 RepID=UPI0011B20A75